MLKRETTEKCQFSLIWALFGLVWVQFQFLSSRVFAFQLSNKETDLTLNGNHAS